MRKVTASAVILTAITGCSQNEAPSAEWSFEPPVTSATALTADNSQRQISEQILSSLSPEARKFIEETNAGSSSTNAPNASSESVGQAKMGPAFEQPNAPESSIQPTPQDVVIPLQTQRLRRIDPIADVRAYLNSTRSSSSFLGDRVPYSAQVALPTAPTYTSPTYNRNAAAFNESTAFNETTSVSVAGPGEASQSGASRLDSEQALVAFPAASNASANDVAPNDAAQALADLNQPSPRFSTSDLIAATAQAPVVDFSSSELSPSALDSPLLDSPPASSGIGAPVTAQAVAQPPQEILPILRSATAQQERLSVHPPHAVPGSPELALSESTLSESQIALDNQAAQVGAPTIRRDENISIGTAILNDLQRNREAENEVESIATRSITQTHHLENRDFAENRDIAEYGSVSSETGDAIVNVESVTDKPTADGLTMEPVVTEPVTAEPAVVEQVELANSNTIQPIVISDQVSVDAKLARLLNTLPQRALSERAETPLISRFRAEQDASPQALVEAAAEPSHPQPSRSLLLEGLEDTSDPTSALQTMYMPIPEAPLASASATLIQTALATLGSNATTASLVSDLSTNDQQKRVPNNPSDRSKALRSNLPSSDLSNSKETADTVELTDSHKVNHQPVFRRYRQRIVWQ
ncbi:MAG: hypothetical protein AAFQ63_00380 [Cyanobacteria bacterium J06621_11]